MIVTKNNQRLYLNSWNYNAACILTELAKIIENNGGRVKPLHTAIVSNRTLTKAKQDCAEKIERLTELEKVKHNESRAAAIATYSKELAELERIDDEPVKVTHTTYISFVLHDFYYYYQIDENPLFEFRYIKTPIQNGKYSKDAYLEDESETWIHKCHLSLNCKKSDIEKSANLIFEMLVTAKPSTILRDSRKQRVFNTYDGRYHYERIYSPERFGKIDF